MCDSAVAVTRPELGDLVPSFSSACGLTTALCSSHEVRNAIWLS